MDLGMTVKNLFELCKDQIERGNGNKHIIISDDDEGNGYHTLFYGFEGNPEDVAFCLTIEHDHSHTVENCIVLG